ncbi:hypothetical protein AVEN_25274-1 [Araneus ventricosus]|uniref:Uncharacterized protein n=1 Tax=Araneus ventricosus TaxID=182803 RepID=A0A4Y2SBW3_ARAVE|nr:hypothetical protein AVEN_25274-1 [Araneus ventricosus]
MNIIVINDEVYVFEDGEPIEINLTKKKRGKGFGKTGTINGSYRLGCEQGKLRHGNSKMGDELRPELSEMEHEFQHELGEMKHELGEIDREIHH